MKQIALALCLMATPALAAEPLAPLEEKTLTDAPVAADKWKADIETWFRSVTALTANFTQMGADGSVTRGKIAMERPGRVRFDYGGKPPILLVGDGKFLFFVDYSNKQVTRYPISETPLRLLLDKHFRFGKTAEIAGWGPGGLANMASVTVRDPKNRRMGALTLVFSKAGGGISLMGWELLDAQNNVTTITLSNTALNGALDKGLWSFKDPRRLGPRAK